MNQDSFLIIALKVVIGYFLAEMAELADARDLKSLGPKARPGSIPGLGTSA